MKENKTIGKLRIIGTLLLTAVIALHAALAAFSYFVPRWVALGVPLVVAGVVFFAYGRRPWRAVCEMLFALCIINIPFGAGGYLYRPWTIAVAFAAVVLPSCVLLFMKRRWWPVFRWLTILSVTAGFAVSVPLRGDAGFNRCEARGSIAGQADFSLQRLPSHKNAYGIYVAPGGCPVIACYSMERKIGVVDCAGRADYYKVRGNPQQIAADPRRNRVYFPLRGTNLVAVATLRPFEITTYAGVPGARGLIGADVEYKTGDVALTGEMKHELFVMSGEDYSLKRRIPLGAGVAYSVAVDQKRGYALVSDWAGLYLHRVDLRGGAVSKLLLPPSAFNVRVDSSAGLAYVSRPLSGRVAVVDIEKMVIVRQLKAGYGVRDIALDTARGKLVCGNYFDGSVDVLDTRTGRRIERYNVGPLVRGVSIERGSGDPVISYTCGLFRIARIPHKEIRKIGITPILLRCGGDSGSVAY